MISCCPSSGLSCQGPNCNNESKYRLDCDHTACQRCILNNYSISAYSDGNASCLNPQCDKIVSLRDIIDLNKGYKVSVQEIQERRKATIGRQINACCCIIVSSLVCTLFGIYFNQ